MVRREPERGMAFRAIGLDVAMNVLIAHDEYLIALDLEQTIKARFGFDAQMCSPDHLELMARQTQFDVVLLEGSGSVPVNKNRFMLVSASGASVILLSSYRDMADKLKGQLPCPVLDIPFDINELISAVRLALEAKCLSDGL
jgi:DNA-binding NarL/FixJ family response regulator